MIYLHNPTHCIQMYGPLSIPPGRYTTVDLTLAEQLEKAGTPLRTELNPEFKPIWKHYGVDKGP